MNTLEKTTLDAFVELNKLFNIPLSKRNEKRISELSTIINHLTNVLAKQTNNTQKNIEADYWARVV